MKTKLLVAYFACLLPISSYASVNTAKLLLDSYGFQCPQVYTPEVGASVQTLQRMSAIVEELKNENSCGSTNEIDSVIGKYSIIYKQYQDNETDALSKTNLEKKIASFTLLLAQPDLDPNVKRSIQQELLSAQSNLININGTLKRFDSFSGQEARAANQLLSVVNQYVSNTQNNPQCMEKKGSQVASLVSTALMTTAAFATGGTALALAAGGVIVQSTAVYLKNKNNNEAQNDINGINTPIALKCMSAVLTDQYCRNEETKKLLLERKNSIDADIPREPSLEGLNMLSYQLSGLSKWLEEIYSGSKINSEGDLINRSKPYEQAHFLKNINDAVQAYTSPREEAIANIKDGAEKTSAIIKLVEEISGIMQGSSKGDPENPLLATIDAKLLPYELFAPGTIRSIPLCDSQNKCSSFRDYIVTKLQIELTMGHLNAIISNAFKLIQKSQDAVSLELNRKVSLDAYTVLVNANRDLNNEVNAYQGLVRIQKNAERIAANLKAIGCQKSPDDCETPLNPYYPQLTNVIKTKEITGNVIALIRESFMPRSLPPEILPLECKAPTTTPTTLPSLGFSNEEMEGKSFQIISCISKMLKIQERGNSVFFTKVRDMVSYDLEARLKNNTLGGAITSVVESTRGDLVTSILNSYKTNDNGLSIDEVILGLETAQNNTKQMMGVFYDFFEKDFKKSIKSDKMSEMEKKDLCFRSIPFLSDDRQDFLKLSYEVCKDVKSQAYKNGPKIAFTDYVQVGDGKTLFGRDKLKLKGTRESRFCFYRNYSRQNKLLDEQARSKDLQSHLNFVRKLKRN